MTHDWYDELNECKKAEHRWLRSFKRNKGQAKYREELAMALKLPEDVLLSFASTKCNPLYLEYITFREVWWKRFNNLPTQRFPPFPSVGKPLRPLRYPQTTPPVYMEM
jgi:hypothetical protein